MSLSWPAAAGDPLASAVLRAQPEDFKVEEELGFEPCGEGEHVFLHLQKRCLNTTELAQRLSTFAGVHPRDVGFSGMKDRNAVTCQWFSVRLAGRPEPDWLALETPAEVEVKEVKRHQRKLKRGVHRGNRFTLVLRELCAERALLEARLQHLREQGAPNYFGPQRFGYEGRNIAEAQRWLHTGGRKLARNKRSLLLSVLRAQLFNTLLADRVAAGDWNRVVAGDICILQGTRSQFSCEQPDAVIGQRCAEGDLHPALPLWGSGLDDRPTASLQRWQSALAQHQDAARFLVEQGLECSWRPARLLADDFYWEFCDDKTLQLVFRLGAGSYATALLAEFVRYNQPQA